ncbi:PREDICTED: uncharacterized protein LOC100639460 [Amphimedon queenslandica]|uniref:SWIM-type domain-containing protein n=1 Tax=Amphimedon queenslandica TaxID=400682 RepID=A0AAN0IRI8_AMPQE|nr:PREDICTED: uncharacterized protein LOC100639460 [Amphimedon queenslandica]|eukprot:XP_011407648.1 PREDICTED: uncharacterized protein LOC100639460 [Amphimedon queenslandica]
MWVENAKSKADIPSPVLLYKQQDVKQIDELNDFSKSDFAIGIQTTFQRDMLMKFGSEAICMDSTHSTNVYDFCLVTILVLDDFGEGVPVGWMISNREDAAALRQFLLKVRNVCGDIQTKVFMSDDADNFYNAWKSIFTVSKTKKLICAWHIDKTWRKGVQEHITVKSKQAEVYHHLRVLLEEVTKGTFHLRLQQFISWLSNDDDLLAFLDYFRKQYVPKIEQWAPCYRGATTVNTNMAIESFHRLLKVCYLEKKQNRRVDHLLHILLKISRDKTFERLQKTQKGKLSHRISEVNKRHRTAQNMNASEVIISNTGATWRIKPTVPDSQEKFYTVEKISDACSCSCRIRCSTCDVCVHSYSCTCMDYLIHSTICKHIHLVEMSFNNVENIITVDDTCTINEERISLDVQPNDELEAPSTELLTEDTCSIETPDISSLQYLTHQIHNQDSINDVSVMKEKAISTCKKVELALRDCTNIEAIKAGRKHLNAAFTVPGESLSEGKLI